MDSGGRKLGSLFWGQDFESSHHRLHWGLKMTSCCRMRIQLSWTWTLNLRMARQVLYHWATPTGKQNSFTKYNDEARDGSTEKANKTNIFLLKKQQNLLSFSVVSSTITNKLKMSGYTH
jgi:hypothetical protein